MREAARRQRAHVDRLSKPLHRRKTVFAHPYYSQDDRDYVTFSIPQDVTQLNQVMDRIHELVGYKLITPVIGLYRFTDRTRIHSVEDIFNNDHVIYVCQGEANSLQNNTSYASSQSSEGSQQRQYWQNFSAMARQNSGQFSGGTSSSNQSKQFQRFDRVDRFRPGSVDIDRNSQQRPAFHVNNKHHSFSHQSLQQPSYQQYGKRSLGSRIKGGLQQQQQQQQSQGEGGRTLLRNSFDKRNLRAVSTMPRLSGGPARHSVDYNSSQYNLSSGQSSSTSTSTNTNTAKKFVSFSERSRSMTNFSLNLPIDELGSDGATSQQTVEPRRIRGLSQTHLPVKSEYNGVSNIFTFDVRINSDGNDLSSAPTYGLRLDNLQNGGDRGRSKTPGPQEFFEQPRDTNKLHRGKLRLNIPSRETLSANQQFDDRARSQSPAPPEFGQLSQETNKEAPIVRLSPIQEPDDSPVVRNTGAQQETHANQQMQDDYNQHDEITLSLTLQDIQEAANQELNRLQQQQQKPQINIPKLQLRENLDELSLTFQQQEGGSTRYNDENDDIFMLNQHSRQYRSNPNSFRSQSNQASMRHAVSARERPTRISFDETESLDAQQMHENRPEDPLEKVMSEEDVPDLDSEVQQVVQQNSYYVNSQSNIDSTNQSEYDQQLSYSMGEIVNRPLARPTTPFYQNDEIERAVERVQNVFGKGSWGINNDSNSNSVKGPVSGEYSVSQTSVNSNKGVQKLSQLSESTSRRRRQVKQQRTNSRKRSSSFWSCMYLPEVHEE
eukprot:TRINITY_DN221_c2_g1_i3.p1 TRINITY_DN221_c2_g1~~TRINITY_DN221_c2_g1_i3.p1  ORF type:complete len:774 (-),score=66.83 TRINITY_DN221_c2_g1_i3:3847-6168(-)